MKNRPLPPRTIGEQPSQRSLLYQLRKTYRSEEGNQSLLVEQLTQRLASSTIEIARLRQALAELTDEEKMDPEALKNIFGEAVDFLEEYSPSGENIQRFKGSTKESEL